MGYTFSGSSSVLWDPTSASQGDSSSSNRPPWEAYKAHWTLAIISLRIWSRRITLSPRQCFL